VIKPRKLIYAKRSLKAAMIAI